MRFVQLLFLTLVLSLCSAPAFAAKVTLGWDPNVETNLAGYKLYYGETLGVYDGNFGDYGPSPVDIPLDSMEDSQDPKFSLTGLPSCLHLYYVLTAYNTEGQESDFSNSVNTTAITKPSVVDFDVSSNGQTISLKWASLEELDEHDDGQLAGYRIQYSDSSGEPYSGDFADQGKSPLSIDPDQTNFSLTGLPLGTSVYVSVEAVCDDGSTSRSAEKTSQITNFNNSSALGGGCSLAPAAGHLGGDLGGVLLVSLLLGLLRLRRRD